MIDPDVVDWLVHFRSPDAPVLLVYLGIAPDPDEVRGVESRLHSLLKPVRELADSDGLTHYGRESLRRDVDRVLERKDRAREIHGHGVAVFACDQEGLYEELVLPRRVRDRTEVDETPYLRPLLAVLDESHRYCVAVVEREKAWLYEFYMGELEDAAKIRGRALRKPDYAGGWQGYKEQAVHDKAQLLARRHFRDTADKVDDLIGRTGTELLIVGGHQETVAEFLPFLPPHVQPRVAGTFVVDPSTMSPGQVRERAEEVVEAYERDEERRYRPPGRPARRRHRRSGTRGGAMDRLQDALLSRRTLLLGGLALGVPAFVAACSSGGGERTTRRPRATTTSPSTGPAGSLTPTPSCGDNAEATRAQTEGPFFEPDSPEKSNFVGDVGKGTKIVLTGSVLTTACQPVARALLDVWHADSDGEYDNEGFRLRGHFFTDDQGAYRLETIVPGNYSGRTKHFHVKVRPPGGRVLTTQLYFPGERQNEQDSIFQPELLMDVRDSASGKDAAFTFVV